MTTKDDTSFPDEWVARWIKTPFEEPTLKSKRKSAAPSEETPMDFSLRLKARFDVSFRFVL